MNTPIKFTGTTKVWTTSTWRNIDYVLDLVGKGGLDEAVAGLNYVSHDMSDTDGWAEIGTAEITVTLHPRDVVVAKELDGLQAKLQAVRAENQQRENAILDRISKLQAIEFAA